MLGEGSRIRLVEGGGGEREREYIDFVCVSVCIFAIFRLEPCTAVEHDGG